MIVPKHNIAESGPSKQPEQPEYHVNFDDDYDFNFDDGGAYDEINNGDDTNHHTTEHNTTEHNTAQNSTDNEYNDYKTRR
jgi:hypothetical protein